MSAPTSTLDLGVLTRFSTPTVANAIELFDVRPRTAGYGRPGLRCLRPDAPPVAGFAVTCRISSAAPDSRGRRESFDYWEHIESQPGPRIAVVEDLDPEPDGSFWGEVNASVHLALQCRAAVTNGTVRDLDEMRAAGFQALYRDVCVSHAYVHVVEFGTPVTVGGMSVRPGDLLQADQHGVLLVPVEVMGDLEAAVQEVERRERPVIDYCRSGTATRQGLVEAVTRHLRNARTWTPSSTY